MKLLWISRIGYKCSYAFVTEGLLKHFNALFPEYELYLFCTGIVHFEEKHQEIANTYHIPKDHVFVLDKEYHNISNPDDLEWYNMYRTGVFHVRNVIEQVKPDCIVGLDDDAILLSLINQVRDLNVPFIPYVAVDSMVMKTVFDVPHIWTMSEFGKEQIQRTNPNSTIHVLPHMIQPIYQPMQSKTEARKLLLRGHTDSFIVGCINANHVRKRWDIMIDAFAAFATRYPNCLLIIKTNEQTNGIGTKTEHNYNMKTLIQQACERYKIPDTSFALIDKELSYEEMNILYNCCDLGVFPTTGEGFGLTPCEMAACNVPVLVPDFSSFPELFHDYPMLRMPVEMVCEEIGRYSAFFQGTISPAGISKQAYFCIAKGFQHITSTTITKPAIAFTPHVPTIIISKNPITCPENIPVVATYATLQECAAKLDLSTYPRYQIAITMDLSIFPHVLQDLPILYEVLTKQPNQKIHVLPTPIHDFRKTVGVTYANHVLEAMERMYHKRNTWDFASLREKYSKRKVLSLFHDTLQNSIVK